MKIYKICIFTILGLFGGGNDQAKALSIKNKSELWFMQSVETATICAHLTPLCDVQNNENLYVRVWIVQESDVLGFDLMKNDHEFKALKIDYSPRKIFGKVKVTSVSPMDGWEQLWENLKLNHIFELPDSSVLKEEQSVVDGFIVVVQIKRGEKCWNYHYKNPFYQTWPEAKFIINILKILAENFPRRSK